MVDYRFEEVQNFRIVIYDVDDKADINNLEKHDFLGEADLKLADVLTAGKVLTKQLMKYSSSKYLIWNVVYVELILYVS